MVPRNTLFATKYYAMRYFYSMVRMKKVIFPSEPAKAVFTSGSGGCQTANGIKATRRGVVMPDCRLTDDGF
jgi:hypothetical protein